ncbi:hypothetical protein ASG69_02080 [Rhodococcus sp. Leaf225]|nr:hypothetical protein ASG69_02080 [Rhodococcus sp. Leaf225]KQU45510.1 hypothetical protein ASH03_09630 [Rhodococcus sp. Leaf258]
MSNSFSSGTLVAGRGGVHRRSVDEFDTARTELAQHRIVPEFRVKIGVDPEDGTSISGSRSG